MAQAYSEEPCPFCTTPITTDCFGEFPEICPTCKTTIPTQQSFPTKKDIEEEGFYKNKPKYPALRFISSMYKLLAFLIGIVAVVIGILSMSGFDANYPLGFGIILGGLIGLITMLAMSEGIKVFLDIEENTRKFAQKQS
jgi:hypothetical protein